MRDGLHGKWFAQRLENLTGVGTPDVLWAAERKSGVLELKVARGNRVRFRAGQVPWLLQWTDQGGRGHVVVWHRGEVKVFAGSHAGRLQFEGILETPRLECDGTWLGILEVLKG